MKVLQLELDTVMKEWNIHRISAKKNAETVKGKPDILYFTPETVGAEEKGLDVDSDEVLSCMELYGQHKTQFGCSEEFVSLVNLLLPDVNGQPDNVSDGLSLYCRLLQSFANHGL